ncbi:sensor histidine kinase [Paenibacillus puldeungensis]|uniref:Sensor histidine kinase n=1 Tax=Paenibacillus puldeungensis TaxID=696536 RepID=A0ABW3RRI4_9BACL
MRILRWNSIRTKLIVFLLIPTVICIAAAIFINYSYTTESLRTRMVEENKNLLYQGYRNIDSYLKEINRISLTVYSDSEFYRLLDAGYDDMSANIRIYASLNYIYNSTPGIYQVYLYGMKNNEATLITENTPKRWQSEVPYSGAIVGSKEQLAIESTHESHHYGITSPILQVTEDKVFSLHRRIDKIPLNQALGYLSIDVRASALNDIMNQLYDRDHEKIYIIDSQGHIVYAGQSELIGTTIKDDWYKKQNTTLQQEQGSFKQDDSVFIYQRIQSIGADWTIVKQIPVSYMLREANQTAKINTLLLGLVLLIIVTATILISIRITAPIKRLSRYMTQVQTGNLNVDVLPAGNDEIGLLTNRFGSMMDTINNLILREYKLELSNKNNQLRALQAQINPHFLNNTLQIIGTLALEMEAPQIYKLISALAKMMHYSMHNDDRTVTLQDELEHVKAYVELQKERFENRFAFYYEIDEGLLSMPMPKIILQPIMENYFKHGIDRTKANGLISLVAERKPDGYVRMIVQNNGSQIPEERLELLRKDLDHLSGSLVHDSAQQDPRKPSIGLINVLARLRLVSGDDAALTVENLELTGVRITLEFRSLMESEEQ